MKIAVMTVDVEHSYLDAVGGTRRFLEIFRDTGVKATFFMTGEVLSNCPDLAGEILVDGHELASHGFTMTRPGGPYLRQMEVPRLREEVRRSREIFEEQGYPIKGFRAPAFSVNPSIIREIAEHFEYDSSVSPGVRKRHRELSDKVSLYGSLVEVPVSGLAGLPVPVGSPSLMAFGGRISASLIRVLGPGNPFVFYSHSFDLGNADACSLGSARWKQMWYFAKCRPERRTFFYSIVKSLANQGFRFMTCGALVEQWLTREKNGFTATRIGK